MLDREGLEVYKYWEDRPQPVASDHADIHTIVYSVRGQEAVTAVVSYAREAADVTLKVDEKALGLDRGYSVTNAETAEPIDADGSSIRLRLKKHDIRVLRLKAGNAR